MFFSVCLCLQLKSLLDCRAICQLGEFKQLTKNRKKKLHLLSDSEWIDVQELVDVLTHPYQVTQLLQKNDFTLSDFYAAWLELKLRLQHSNHKLAKCLCDSMGALKHGHLLENPLMHCSIFMDPRIKCDLVRDSQKSYVTKAYLSKLYDRINEISSRGGSHNDMPAEKSTNKFEYSFLTEYLNTLQCSETAKTGSNIFKLLDDYESGHSEDLNVSILDFWEEKKLVWPELYQLANIVHAVPATQSSVERTFSTLSFVFGKLRSNLSPQILEDILIIKLNSDIFKSVFAEEMKN